MINVNFTEGVEVLTSNTQLYQWDSNQQITISGLQIDNVSVHFATKKRTEAIVVVGKKDGDNLVADIPNILLEDDCDIIAYIHVVANNKGNTIKVVRIPKILRQKPTDYQFTDNVDIMTFERLEYDFNDLSNEVHEKMLDLDSYCNNLTQQTQNTCNQILANANEEVKKIENNYEIELNTKAEIGYVDDEIHKAKQMASAQVQNLKDDLNDFGYVKTCSVDNVEVPYGGTAEAIIDTKLDITERFLGLAGYNISNASTEGWGGSYGTVYKAYNTSNGFAISVRNLYQKDTDKKNLRLKIYLYILVAKRIYD